MFEQFPNIYHKSVDPPCPRCNGTGELDSFVVPVCCGFPEDNGECCGMPIPQVMETICECQFNKEN